MSPLLSQTPRFGVLSVEFMLDVSAVRDTDTLHPKTWKTFLPDLRENNILAGSALRSPSKGHCPSWERGPVLQDPWGLPLKDGDFSVSPGWKL